MKILKAITLLILSYAATGVMAQGTIDLSGKWEFTLNPSKGYNESVSLPGTMDENSKGKPNPKTDETTRLTRKYTFAGPAWYRRIINIPKHKGWKHENVWLTLERTKPSTIYIDGDSVSYSNDISTPQAHNLGILKPGKHLLTIKVDNAHGIPEQLYASSHAICEDTQTNWNGILGNICLSFSNIGISSKLLPDGSGIVPSCSIIKYNPIKYCFNDFHIEGQHFFANGHEIFLRGKHDACVWPKTGHCPMDVSSWLKYFKTCQEYGINHIRFHSWCPPDEAFSAADSLGIYLQPELPFWGDFNANDSVLMNFLKKEGENIIMTYGNHPSFVMLGLGNELWGSIDKMKEFVDDFRQLNPQILYTFGSNYYLGYQGVKPGMDYFTTCRIGGEAWGKYNTHTRGSFSFADAYEGGVINHFRPNTIMNFSEVCATAKVPIISHETGQFQSYPDYKEISKYDSTIFIPYNFITFRNRLKQTGMLEQATDFHRASGSWAWQLYKADIEMDLRTRNMAGFQLLDLQDYPGQGSAFVGVLDAFMDSKGYGTPEEWRQFCSPVVPLLEVPSFCYEDGDTIRANMKIANYSGKSLKGEKLVCYVDSQQVANLQVPDGEGLLDIPESIVLPVKTTRPETRRITLSIPGTDYKNSWQLWIYPKKSVDAGKIIETSVLTPAIIRKLEKGASVLWSPDSMSIASDSVLSSHTVGGLFMTDYWNYRMFKTICENNHKAVSPGTLGILTNPDNAIFNEFPTEEHTNWQWWAMTKFSHPLILDGMPSGYKPVVQVIDNIERNHKLGLVMEFTVGHGRLLICMSDLSKAVKWQEGRAFRRSIISYMQSSEFRPTLSFTSINSLSERLFSKTKEAKLDKLNNISQY